MRRLRFLSLCIVLLCSFSVSGFAETKLNFSVKDVIVGHLSDSYEWHMASWNDFHLTIPLPVIVKGENSGWHCFSSSKLTEAGDRGYENFYINSQDGKIYERVGSESRRPLDLSITKNVVQIWIAAALMLIIFLGCAHWYKKKDVSSDSPKGFVGFIEMFVDMVVEDIVIPSIGKKHYRPYVPYILTLFFFVFTVNILGLIPFFPGGANVTGNISITLFLAFCTFLAVNLFGNREYWKDVFWPNVPLFLKCPIPLMPIIEIIGVISKPFALMVRLFANIMGGHAVILSLTCIIFITFQVSLVIGTSLSAISFLLMIFMNCIEVLVAFIQAYVFAILSSVFIGLAHPEVEENN